MRQLCRTCALTRNHDVSALHSAGIGIRSSIPHSVAGPTSSRKLHAGPKRTDTCSSNAIFTRVPNCPANCSELKYILSVRCGNVATAQQWTATAVHVRCALRSRSREIAEGNRDLSAQIGHDIVRSLTNRRCTPDNGSSNSSEWARSRRGVEKSPASTSVTLGYNGSPVIGMPSADM